MQVWSPSPQQHRPPCPVSKPCSECGLSLVWAFPYPCLTGLMLIVEAKLLVCIPHRGEVSSRASVDRGRGRNVEGASQGCTYSPGLQVKAVHDLIF